MPHTVKLAQQRWIQQCNSRVNFFLDFVVCVVQQLWLWCLVRRENACMLVERTRVLVSYWYYQLEHTCFRILHIGIPLYMCFWFTFCIEFGYRSRSHTLSSAHTSQQNIFGFVCSDFVTLHSIFHFPFNRCMHFVSSIVRLWSSFSNLVNMAPRGDVLLSWICFEFNRKEGRVTSLLPIG